MRIIEPNVTEVTDFEGVDNFYKATARAARICYAKEMLTEEQAHYLLQQGKITLSESIKNTANIENDKALCERLIKLGHLSPFEHSILYIPIYGEFRKWAIEHRESKEWKIIDTAKTSIYTVVNCNKDDNFEIAINGRTLVESIREHSDSIIQTLDSILEIIKMFELNNHWFKSFIVDTSIGCTRELNRHDKDFYYTDPLDICEQSTRFCNFSKDKFGNELAFNKPYWYDEAYSYEKEWWEGVMKIIENLYLFSMKLEPDDKNYPIKKEDLKKHGLGWTTDRARGILPIDTHTRAIYTSTIEEWQHIIDLRLKGTTGKPHGDIKIIIDKINKLINDETGI